MDDWRSRLRAEIDRSGRTRAQICHAAGLNPAYLTQVLEHKAATPRIDNLAKLAEVLETTVSFIVEGVELDGPAAEALSLFQSLCGDRRQAALVVLRDMAEAAGARAAGPGQ
ncbi:MAG: helix-turn-helix transcriptional regulator [Pseudomonadota bacterium]